MSYLVPSEFVTKMIDAGESKIFMSTRDTLVRAYMAGAILALAAWFAITINVNTGQPLVGALLFPVGFSMLILLGFDLLTGVFVLCPLAWLDNRPGVTIRGILRNWGLVFVGNFCGALTTAFLMAFVTTYGFTQAPDKVGTVIGNIGEARNSRLCSPRSSRYGNVVPPRRIVQLDGFDRRRRRHDIDVSDGQGHRHVDAHPGLLLHGL